MQLDDLIKMRVLYTVPGMERAQVTKDVTYQVADGLELKMDVYRPEGTASDALLPAVLFVHGEAPWELVKDVQQWGQYSSWGQLAAASGLVGITFMHRPSERFTKLPEVVSDVDAALAYVREHAQELGVDADRLALWVCSAGGPVGLRTVFRDRPDYVRCVAAYYPALDLRPHTDLLEHLTEEELLDFSPLYQLEQAAEEMPPLLMVKAGLDSPFFNEHLEGFKQHILPRNPAFRYLEHESGNHAFEVRDEGPRTEEIVRETLDFLRSNLLG
jgi:acetyl esterase/lipase